MPLSNPITYHIYHGQPLPPPKFYSYIMAGQGLFKWTMTPHFEASILVAPGRVAGLPDWPGQTRLTEPRIPLRWLTTVANHARRAGQGLAGAIEQMYHFHYLPQGWRVSVPSQIATASQVLYQGGDEPSVVLDLHSHHTMRANFSRTDNNDEQGCRFYGVIGNIYENLELSIRVGVWGDFQMVKLAVLFDVG